MDHQSKPGQNTLKIHLFITCFHINFLDRPEVMGNFLYAHSFSKITHLVLDDNFHIQLYLLGGPESKQRNSNPITQFFTLCKYRASEIRRRHKNKI